MLIKEKLSEALQNKKNDINSFIWKGRKIKVGNQFIQQEIKLVDASDAQLREFADYCKVMLYNTDKNSPGREIVLATIADQRMRCNVELCLRQLENNPIKKTPRYQLNEKIQEVLSSMNMSSKGLTLKDVSNIDDSENEYSNLPLNLIIDGCLDKLGIFNRKSLTLSFILKQGLWLTQQEVNDLTEHDEEGNIRNRIDVVRERLNINSGINFKIDTKGLSYAQLRAMLQLKNKKYSEMTTEQLKVLRNRILFNLETEVKHHISQWANRLEQIQLVANNRGINL